MKPIFEQERQFFYKNTNIMLPQDCWRKGTKIYLDCTCKIPIYAFKVKNKKLIIVKNYFNKHKNYVQKSIEELVIEYDMQLNYLKKNSINHIIDYILAHPNHKYVINHSGGKDSTVLYDIWMQSLEILKFNYIEIYNNLDWEINFSNTSNDTADTYKYIKTKLPKNKLHILNPTIGFYQWIINIKNYFIPSVMVRNCCSTYKEGQIAKYYDKKQNIIMIMGVRKYESSKRANYDYIIDCDYIRNILKKSPNIPETWVKFNPIVEWKDEEIWLYILREQLEYNNQYNIGFNRCGCLICPYQSDYTDLLIEEYYPNLWKRWIEILKKNYELYDVANRLKWTLKEYIQGKWKAGISVEQELIQKKPTQKNVKKLSEIKGISEDIAIKYFQRKCDCGKKLNSDEIALNLKIYGREMQLHKMECKKCFCKKNNISGKKYVEMVHNFRIDGCTLF